MPAPASLAGFPKLIYKHIQSLQVQSMPCCVLCCGCCRCVATVGIVLQLCLLRGCSGCCHAMLCCSCGCCMVVVGVIMPYCVMVVMGVSCHVVLQLQLLRCMVVLWWWLSHCVWCHHTAWCCIRGHHYRGQWLGHGRPWRERMTVCPLAIRMVSKEVGRKKKKHQKSKPV